MVEKLKENQAVDVEWLPFYLRPDIPEEGMELPAYIRAKGAEVNARLQQMAKGYGMEMMTLTRLYNTRRAHEATEYARTHGKANAFHKVVFRKVYAEGQDISRWDALRSGAEAVGLNPDEMQAEVDSGKYTRVVQDLVDEAYALGVNGVPTYVLNDRYAIVGAQPYSVFEQAIAQLANEPAGEEGQDED